MAPYHKLIVIIGSVIPENLVLLTKSEQFGPKSAHICPTNRREMEGCHNNEIKNSTYSLIRCSFGGINKSLRSSLLL